LFKQILLIDWQLMLWSYNYSIISTNLNADNVEFTTIPVTESCDCQTLDFFNDRCEWMNTTINADWDLKTNPQVKEFALAGGWTPPVSQFLVRLAPTTLSS